MLRRPPPAGSRELTPSPPLVWITRAEPGARRTAERVAALGFTPLVAPLIATRDLPGPGPDLEGVAALAFTSARGVRAFAERTSPPALPVFAVGDATAEAARDAGFTDVRSAKGAGRDLLFLLLRDVPADGAVLYAGAREPAFDLVAALRLVDRPARALPLYETVPREHMPEAAEAALTDKGIAAILLHSPAAARALAAIMAAAPGRLAGAQLIALSLECVLPLAGEPFAAVSIAKAPDESSLLNALLGAGLAPR